MDREELRDLLDEALDVPMAILAFIALVLIIIDLTTEVSPEWRLRIDMVFWFVWTAFLAEYIAKLLLSENKRRYIRTHWIELAILIVPFLRIFIVFRILKVTRSLAMLRLLLYTRFGINEFGKLLGHRIFYLTIITTVVIFSGAAGMYLLEYNEPGSRVKSFGDALWMTASLVTTVASDIFPTTAGGRVLAFVLMVYSMVVFSYLAASIAAFFVRKKE
jgi:voltage-gated potassium channel